MTEREAIDLAESLNLPRPARTREPGRNLKITLGEIADAHLRGVRWTARGGNGQFSVWEMLNRADYAKKLCLVYRWVEGSARRGYAMVACPKCRVVTCFGAECERESGHDART